MYGKRKRGGYGEARDVFELVSERFQFRFALRQFLALFLFVVALVLGVQFSPVAVVLDEILSVLAVGGAFVFEAE